MSTLSGTITTRGPAPNHSASGRQQIPEEAWFQERNENGYSQQVHQKAYTIISRAIRGLDNSRLPALELLYGDDG